MDGLTETNWRADPGFVLQVRSGYPFFRYRNFSYPRGQLEYAGIFALSIQRINSVLPDQTYQEMKDAVYIDP